jgi:hypothetical protein
MQFAFPSGFKQLARPRDIVFGRLMYIDVLLLMVDPAGLEDGGFCLKHFLDDKPDRDVGSYVFFPRLRPRIRDVSTCAQNLKHGRSLRLVPATMIMCE